MKKFFKMNQPRLNTIILLCMGLTILLAMLSHFHKQIEGYTGSGDWELTMDGDSASLQHKGNNTFSVAEDGTIKNATFDEINERIAQLKQKLETKINTTGPRGSAGIAGPPGVQDALAGAAILDPAGEEPRHELRQVLEARARIRKSDAPVAHVRQRLRQLLVVYRYVS